MLYVAYILALGCISCFALIAFAAARRKNVDIIVRGGRRRAPRALSGAQHVFFCVADHFEPFWNGADRTTALQRVEQWKRRYPLLCERFRDGGGRPPQHTFFYPAEEYEPQALDALAGLVRPGFGDVEIHLHHDRDTADGFAEKINAFRDALHVNHGLLRADPSDGRIRYGFIHGNWALDDSGPRGKHCGVKNELAILKETGCYADFTYPSAPHPTQPPVINKIYYPAGDPLKGKSHHARIEAAFRTAPPGGLLLVTGPLAINWHARRRRIFPAIENGDITALNPPTPARIDLWVRTGVGVAGWPGWIFIKVHTHGAQEKNAGLLLGGGIQSMHEYLLSRYNDGGRYVLHYVTAWELYQCVAALERGDEEWMRRIEGFRYLPRDIGEPS
ncbi:MAG: hypothetical protein HY770_08815 [Chitinivibrionia bacterium]|nr:hypothetical protein [Chitinivibrionia bacterium]